jgi:diaminopimelate decarboxylase
MNQAPYIAPTIRRVSQTTANPQRLGRVPVMAEGALIQVDNRDEILTLARLAEERDATIEVGIRVHVDTGTHAVWSKFGFNADDGEALRMIGWAKEHTRLRIRGIHCHVGTFMLDSGAYATAAKAVVELALAAEAAGAGPVAYLSLGGGFASHARLHGQYLPPEQATPSFGDYANAICGTIKQHWPAYGKGGVSTGLGASRRNAVVLDAGINILYTTAWYQPAIYPASAALAGMQATTVYGCLCMNIDVIREEASLPDLKAGDAVVIHPVGAYNINQSMQFIAYRPAVVMIDPAQRVHLIRRCETLEDVQGPEEVPGYLRLSNKNAAVPAPHEP